MKQHLLVTTSADSSVSQFRPYADVLLLDSVAAGVAANSIDIASYKTVYIRSAFHRVDIMPQQFADIIDKLGARARQAGISVIDGVDSVEKIIKFEDKWQQYQLFGELMPTTELVASDTVDDRASIFKKRISSRAAGIAWRLDEIYGERQDWIKQALVDIRQELRIYIVRGSVYPVAAVRQPKTSQQKIKVVGARPLSSDQIQFAQMVYQKCPEVDFVGLDVVDGQTGLWLLEANRSPIFSSFLRESGVNLAEILYK